MGDGIKAWREDEEAEVQRRAVIKIQKVPATRLLAALHNVEHYIEALIKEDLPLKKHQHQLLEDGLEEIRLLIRGDV